MMENRKDIYMSIPWHNNKPVQEEFNADLEIRELIKTCSPPWKLMENDFIKSFGEFGCGQADSIWYWNKKRLEEASDEELWKFYGLVQGWWLTFYKYLAAEKEYNLKEYIGKKEGKKPTIVKIEGFEG